MKTRFKRLAMAGRNDGLITDKKTCYEILKISDTASKEEIEQACEKRWKELEGDAGVTGNLMRMQLHAIRHTLLFNSESKRQDDESLSAPQIPTTTTPPTTASWTWHSVTAPTTRSRRLPHKTAGLFFKDLFRDWDSMNQLPMDTRKSMVASQLTKDAVNALTPTRFEQCIDKFNQCIKKRHVNNEMDTDDITLAAYTLYLLYEHSSVTQKALMQKLLRQAPIRKTLMVLWVLLEIGLFPSIKPIETQETVFTDVQEIGTCDESRVLAILHKQTKLALIALLKDLKKQLESGPGDFDIKKNKQVIISVAKNLWVIKKHASEAQQNTIKEHMVSPKHAINMMPLKALLLMLEADLLPSITSSIGISEEISQQTEQRIPTCSLLALLNRSPILFSSSLQVGEKRSAPDSPDSTEEGEGQDSEPPQKRARC